ncbi:MAG: DNA translocase FtsK [Planctomycetota bacterium]
MIHVKPTGGIDWRRDGRGLALFTAGAFFAVLLALAVGSSEPLERVSGTGVLARVWAGTVGLLPGLIFCVGIAGLGAWEFLAGGVKDLMRHARGLALTALGLSILVGAFSESAGGFLGHHSSGAIARYVHVVPAALIGLVSFLLPIWIHWLKPAILEDVVVRPKAPSREVRAPRAPTAVPETPRPAPVADLGVTADEAAALIPQDLPSWRSRPRKSVAVETPATAPSPYPEDVRRRGEVPQGAKLLHPPHVETPRPRQVQDELEVPALQARAPEPQRFAVATGEDLARPAPAIESDPVLEMPPYGSTPRADAFDELRLALEELAYADPEPEAPAETTPEPTALMASAAPIEATEDAEEVVESTSGPRASWEQPDLFTQDEEPVDAYGTPISVVESVRADGETQVDEDEAQIDEDEAQGQEPEVTLKPVAASRPRKKSSPNAPKASGDRHAVLLAEIGCHLLDRGRVAVSMLQREYGMDFAEATKVLDELQQMGLIGPYLGGQRRDILLTREEWLEKVSSL